LSASDLGSLVTMLFASIFLTPAFLEADLPFESAGIYYLIFGIPHLALTRVSSCLTSLIAVDRCLSVISPLK
ncbi:unnamed protein product, partial [Candidula unifasciata]